MQSESEVMGVVLNSIHDGYLVRDLIVNYRSAESRERLQAVGIKVGMGISRGKKPRTEIMFSYQSLLETVLAGTEYEVYGDQLFRLFKVCGASFSNRRVNKQKNRCAVFEIGDFIARFCSP